MKLSPSALPFLLLATIAAAEPPKYPGTPRVTSIAPLGWHRGGTAEVEFRGLKLFDPRGVLCADTDHIKVTKIVTVAADPKVPDSGGKKAIASLQIASDCPTGVHYLRLYTNYGVAEVMPFFVGSLPTHVEAELVEKAKLNNTQETAEVLSAPATVNGWLLGDDEDIYKYEVKKGQLISAEIECARLALETDDGTEVILTVRDGAGKTLATCDDTSLLLADPFLTLTAPADGPLFVSVKPLLPAATARRIPYRLHLGDFRRPAGVYPAGGKPGDKISAQLVGLPPGVPDKVEISLPATGSTFSYHVDSGTPTANQLRLLEGANVLEIEPNDAATQATAATGAAPVALNGILQKNGDMDCFKFSAKKGERLIIDGYAQALGSPADLQLEILPANSKAGQTPDKADDSTDGDLNNFEQTYSRERLDPSLIFTAKETADYLLTVKDSRSIGSASSIYRIEITHPKPGVLTGFFAPDNNQKNSRISSQVARGNRALFLMNVRPTYGTDKISGELKLTARNLPPGVTMTAAPFTIDQKRLPIMFEAAADAPVSGAMLEFDVQPTDPAAPPLHSFFSHNIALTYANGDIATAARFDKLAFSVSDEVPFKISVTQPTIPLSRSGELLLAVELTRSPGFTDPVDIGVENTPLGIVPQTGSTITGDATQGTLRLAAEGGAPFGKFPIVVTARTRATAGDERAGRLRASSNQILLEVSEPFVRVKLTRSSIERGKNTKVKATIESVRPFPGAATMKLIRLPKGLQMAGDPISISNDVKELSLELIASPDALVGTYPSIACEVAVTSDGKELKQVVGTGIIRVDPARQ